MGQHKGTGLGSTHSEERARHFLTTPLDYPGLPKRRLARQEFRIWRAPSFHPESSWSLLCHNSEWFVRRVVCTRLVNADVAFFDTFGSEAPVPEPIATQLLRGLRDIHLAPFVPNQGVGLDGVRYGLEVDDLNKFAMSWWEEAPQEWHALKSWYFAAIDMFEQLLP
jgi:hypothetical protein